MKKLLTLILLISSINIYSENTYLITESQLRTTNEIFIEHKELKKELPLLQQKITNLEEINEIWRRIDSTHSAKLLEYENIILNNNDYLNNLEHSIKTRNTIIISEGILIILLILII